MFSWFSWALFLYVGEWVIRLVMLPVVVQRRDPSSATTWLLIIFFFPYFGLVLYLLIGENRLPRRRVEQHANLLRELQAIVERFRSHPNIVRPNLGQRAELAVTLAEKLADLPILGGNNVEFMTETDEVIDRLVADIDAAEDHVHLLFYIYADDATGRRVMDALAEAVKRGVTCRVLADAVGSRPMFKTLATKMRDAGIELHAMLPVNLFRRNVARIDLRNHRKMAIIDGKTAYAGSQNIVDANYGHKDLAWHDMMMRLTGPITLEVQAVFLQDWYFETGEVLDNQRVFPDPQVCGETPIQTLPSGPSYETENYQRMVVAGLYAARKQVTITTPYFVPDEPLMQAMQVAVLRGVEVNVIVPSRCDQFTVGAAARAYYDDFLVQGGNLYLYTDGLLHAKTITIDDGMALVGSSNFDNRSFALNFELNMLLYGPQVTEELLARQRYYLQQSTPLDLEEWRKRPALAKLIENTARLLSPLL